MWQVVIVSTPTIILLFGVVAWFGKRKRKQLLNQFQAKLDESKNDTPDYDTNSIKNLPAVVQAYLNNVLGDTPPLISSVKMRHHGTINMSETAENWKSFTSTQQVNMHRLGFDWAAEIKFLPGMTVLVHDAYIGGEGILQASLLGLIPLAESRGSTDIARGELLRFLAESPWYPSKLFSGQGVTWQPIDQSSAKASLTDGDHTVSVTFHFNLDGLIDRVRAESRGRMLAGQLIDTPWEGKWSCYKPRHGILVPTKAEVAWIVDGEPRTYWRGELDDIDYELSK